MAERLDPAVADAPRQHLVDAAAPAMRKLLERVACGEWGAGEAVDILLDWPNRAGDRSSWGSEFVTALAGRAGARSDPGRSIRGDALAVRDAQLAEARSEVDRLREVAAHGQTLAFEVGVSARHLYDAAAAVAERRIPGPLGVAVAGVLAVAAESRRVRGLAGSLGEHKTTLALAIAVLELPATPREGDGT